MNHLPYGANHYYTRRKEPIEPRWSIAQRRIHFWAVWIVNAAVGAIPLGDAIIAVAKGHAPSGTVAVCALGVVTVVNMAAHAYATHGLKFEK
jgi:hypothetical protein